MEIVLMVLTSILILALLIAVVFFLQRKSRTDKEQSGSIRDLERRITDLMSSNLKEIRDNQLGDSREMHRQISDFTKEATKIREELKKVEDNVKEVSSFQDIFKSPKLRGQWGEASLDHILSQHFPEELFSSQYLFSSGEQVDAVLKLPNGKILPIDAKFPTENFVKMAEAEEKDKTFFQKKFVEDVKFKINDISSKYILSSENTVDFALMYIPAEAVYYEIVNNISKETDLNSYAWSKRIILASPNTIYLTLRTIEHWFRDTQVSKKTQDILKRLGKISEDSRKLSDDFRKLGSHLRNTVSAYESSEKRLSVFSQRVEKLIDIKDQKRLRSKSK
jgi:DNA recombination protein RmuC